MVTKIKKIFILSAIAILLAQVMAIPANAAPRVPQDPVVVYHEEFENVADPNVPEFLNAYTGPPPLNMTYTAHSDWISGPACNGIIGSFNSGPGTTGCPAGTYSTFVGPLMQAIGNEFGGGDDNHAMSDVTVGGFPAAPTPAATLETVDLLPLPGTNRFIAFSIDVAATTCVDAHPLLRFFLIDGPDETSVNNDAIDPCTDPGGVDVPGGLGGIRVGSYATDGALLFAGDQIGVKLTNDQTNGQGNDYAVDNIRVLDATPHLDKEFGQGEYAVGDAIPLTFIITNTTELAAKPGWSFTDTLASDLTIADDPGVQSTCTNPNIGATPGNATITMTGDLNDGQEYCEVTVNVTASSAGTFTNGASNITVNGLNPPVDTTTVGVKPAAELANTGQSSVLLAGLGSLLIATALGVTLKSRAPIIKNSPQ